MKKTRIVATVGPACNNYETLRSMIVEGVNVFRLNFSHGSHESHKSVIDDIRRLNKELVTNVAILGDLQGPKLRVGEIENGAIELAPNASVVFTNEKCIGTSEKIYVSYPNLHDDVEIGQAILVDDGKVELVVTAINHEAKTVTLLAPLGGIISTKKGINLPNTKISLPCLTEKDLLDLEFIIEQKLDWVALSFVRTHTDIIELKTIINARNSFIKVIAKIEKPEALDNLREIILEADGVMVARGDLGVELPIEKIPLIQKTIIRKCIHRAKPVIMATQMMESMMENTRPSRAEITDVSNAVLEGADAVMLSGETASGKHPVLVIQTMKKIIMEVETENVIYNRNLTPQKHSPTFLSDALCYNAAKIANEIDANALIAHTRSGYTGFMVSSFRPHCPIYIFTDRPDLVNQSSLCWGVRRAFYFPNMKLIDDMIAHSIQILKTYNLVKATDVVVNTGAMPVADEGPTNMIKISEVY
jgi:pyruvate kinase